MGPHGGLMGASGGLMGGLGGLGAVAPKKPPSPQALAKKILTKAPHLHGHPRLVHMTQTRVTIAEIGPRDASF